MSGSNENWPMSLAKCVNASDLRELARKRLPYPIFDHIDGGSDDEVTLGYNTESFGAYSLIPHYCSGVESVDASTTVMGQQIEWPYFAGPVGGLKYLHPHGEIGMARAAHNLGTAYTMSGFTNTTPEDIAAAAPDGPLFFQMQPCRSREVMADMLKLAKDSGYKALIVTVDNPIHGNRERDVRSGFGLPANFSLGAWMSIFLHPFWGMRTLPLPGFGLYDKYMDTPGDLNWLAEQLVTNLTWDDMAWIRSQWDGPFALKGLVAIDDIKRAVDTGVSAVVLSNQGARHFDTAPASFEILPDVVNAVGDQIEIILDGGIRRGTDILKAIALGATACSGGRVNAFGLSAGGQRGVERGLSLLRDEVERDMIFLGAASLADVDASRIMKRT